MTVLFVRIFFVILSTVIGFSISTSFIKTTAFIGIVGAAVGCISSVVLMLLERVMQRVSTRNLSAGVFGLVFGLFMSWVVTTAIKLIPMSLELYSSIQMVLTAVFCYLGMVIAIRGKDEFKLVIPYVKFTRENQRDELILLDTSVIIDGRIADLCLTKFIEGRFVVPRFVLRELQQIADSQDVLKRNRGRRGLDILNKIQKNTHIDVKIEEEDFPDISDVDAKLVKLATVFGAKIFTNDFNLNKIAQIQGVTVLNINDLANALKPVVLPGEMMEVRIIKEGKEFNQGVAYLDDGTMVVVDNTKHLIGQTVKAMVTSVLQTSAGRMIFAKYDSNYDHQANRRQR